MINISFYLEAKFNRSQKYYTHIVYYGFGFFKRIFKIWRVIDMTIDEVEKIKTVVENKDYIVKLVNTFANTMIEAFENLKIEDVNMFQLGYKKAIDDAKSVILQTLANEILVDTLHLRLEQLKERNN